MQAGVGLVEHREIWLEHGHCGRSPLREPSLTARLSMFWLMSSSFDLS